jgi:hypothetical protein
MLQEGVLHASYGKHSTVFLKVRKATWSRMRLQKAHMLRRLQAFVPVGSLTFRS